MRSALAHRIPDILAAFAATSRSILITDATADNPVAYANAGFSALFGYSEAEAIGRNCRFLQGVDTDPRVVSEIRRALALGVSIRCDILNYRKDGTSFWNDLTIDPIRDAAGQLLGFVSIQSQADVAHLANEARADAESKLDSIARNIPGFIYRQVMRSDGAIDLVYCSPSLGKMLGITGGHTARSFYDHIHPDDHDALFAAIRLSAANMSIFREEFRLVSPGGITHWLRSEAPPRRMKNGEIVWDALALEFSAEKRWQSEFANLMLRDPLTGLLNREAWRQALTRQVEPASGKIRRCGLLIVDIEKFRDLNAKLGQRVCDDILVEIAQRLTTLAASAFGVAARLGGDEFAILVPDCAGDDALSRFAGASSEALARQMQVGVQHLTIRTCIGATFYAGVRDAGSADEDVVSELTAQAELALQRAKQAGHGAAIVYSAAQDDRLNNRAVLARSLERAIEDGELELHYQPVVELASGRILSAEALVRWNHPTLGMQPPDLFIPIAEASGLIVPLGRWVFDQAVRQWTLWHDAGLSPPPIAINVSGIQLVEPAFVNFVAESLMKLKATARNFEIELTEGQVIEASPLILATLHALRNMGFLIVIDDFGSGHATFRYLRDFPVDKVKMDQLFVRKLVLNSSDALIVRAVNSLARSMGIAFVAEGIETEMQRDFLQSEGCKIGQGYLFSMPLLAEDFAWMLANDVRLPMLKPPIREDHIDDIEPEPPTRRRS